MVKLVNQFGETSERIFNLVDLLGETTKSMVKLVGKASESMVKLVN